MNKDIGLKFTFYDQNDPLIAYLSFDKVSYSIFPIHWNQLRLYINMMKD